MDYLMAYLGEEALNKAMQAYFEEWHFKHPMPEDSEDQLKDQQEKISAGSLTD